MISCNLEWNGCPDNDKLGNIEHFDNLGALEACTVEVKHERLQEIEKLSSML